MMVDEVLTVTQAYRFALDPTPSQARRMSMFAGASRFACNRMLAHVKDTLNARDRERRMLGEPVTESQGWSLAALRRTWNANKETWAPWWGEVSKEAFNHGLECLTNGLGNWVQTRAGNRGGRPVGFPRFKARNRTRPSFCYTTGSIRVLDDRRSVQLPRLGRIHTHENTRKLHRRLSKGTARILRATVSRDAAGRWHVSFTVEVQRARRANSGRRYGTVGVDVGVKDLVVAATGDGTEVLRVAAPKPLQAAQSRLRSLQHRATRQQKGSHRHARTLRRIGRLHAQVANIRRDVLHKTTTQLARSCEVVVIEDLHVAGMGRKKRGAGSGGRGLNRAVADAAMGELGRMLGYKTDWYDSQLVVADRWFLSSKTCSGCGNRKPRLPLSERTYRCETCGLVIDRDHNAAVNLARWPQQANVPPSGSGPEGTKLGHGADQETDPAQAGDAGGYETSIPHGQPSNKTGTAFLQRTAV